MRYLLIFALTICPLVIGTLQAEIYQDIGPLDTLADVKAKFPNATFEQLKPAWAQPADVMYAITGHGISGTIIVKFLDGRPGYRSRLEVETDEQLRAWYEEWATQSDEEALQVEWVRWVPADLIPLKRFVAKYGEPEEAGFRDDNMAPYRRWERGIHATLDDDMKNVMSVEFSFTAKDERAAWLEKYGFVPQYLREPTQPQPRKTPAKSKSKSKTKPAA